MSELEKIKEGLTYNSVLMGERLKALQQQYGLSDEAMASIAKNGRAYKVGDGAIRNGVNIKTYQNWKCGSSIKHEYLVNFANTLDCEIGYLYGEFSEKHRSTGEIKELIQLSSESIEILKHCAVLNSARNITFGTASEMNGQTKLVDLIIKKSGDIQKILDLIIQSQLESELLKEDKYYSLIEEAYLMFNDDIQSGSLQNDCRDLEALFYSVLRSKIVVRLREDIIKESCNNTEVELKLATGIVDKTADNMIEQYVKYGIYRILQGKDADYMKFLINQMFAGVIEQYLEEQK